MEDMTKVVLHTPTLTRAIKLNWEGKLDVSTVGAVADLTLAGYRATLVAVQDREEVRVGLSMCNIREDNFEKVKGIANGTYRALTSPIYVTKGQLSKKELLALLKEQHTLVATNIVQYKKVMNA